MRVGKSKTSCNQSAMLASQYAAVKMRRYRQPKLPSKFVYLPFDKQIYVGDLNRLPQPKFIAF